MTVRVRPLRAGDEPAVRGVFRSTIAMGRPLVEAARFERLRLADG